MLNTLSPMTTYNHQPPEDLHLTPKEVQRETAQYLFGQASLTGESIEKIAERMGPLINYLGSLKVVREKYSARYSYEPTATKGDRADRLKGISDTVRRTITTNGLVEGDAVNSIREWQKLGGDRAKGLLLLGGAGSGKTLHAACLLLGNVLTVDPDGYWVGESVLSTHLGTGTKSDKREALTPLEAAPLLVIDFMGLRKPQTGWEAAVMEFMRIRWEAGRKCVLTFRGDLDAFKRCYGADGWATAERFCTVLKVRREG